MDQLLIALDVDSAARAMELSDQLRDVAGGFKIGGRLFTAEGPEVVRQLAARGNRVFLDLKYHDIPSTVAGAVRAAKDLGVWMLTVHASGGTDMLLAAKEASVGAMPGPLVVAVTVLTSFDEPALRQLGVTRRIAEQVECLAEVAQDAGVDGVVASPLEIKSIRARCGPSFTIVTPGIRSRMTDTPKDDQTRTRNATESLRAGADYLVVGRPVINAPDPHAAAVELCQQMTEV